MPSGKIAARLLWLRASRLRLQDYACITDFRKEKLKWAYYRLEIFRLMQIFKPQTEFVPEDFVYGKCAWKISI